MSTTQRRVVEFFLRGGCLRTPNDDRREEGPAVYKKGWEVRFYTGSRTEAGQLRALLREVGLKPGSPYRKRPNRWIQPVYGREQVETFIRWVRAAGAVELDA